MTVQTRVTTDQTTVQTDQMTISTHSTDYSTTMIMSTVPHFNDHYKNWLWETEMIHCLTNMANRTELKTLLLLYALPIVTTKL